jgi:hypothetical protein
MQERVGLARKAGAACWRAARRGAASLRTQHALEACARLALHAQLVVRAAGRCCANGLRRAQITQAPPPYVPGSAVTLLFSASEPSSFACALALQGAPRPPARAR